MESILEELTEQIFNFKKSTIILIPEREYSDSHNEKIQKSFFEWMEAKGIIWEFVEKEGGCVEIKIINYTSSGFRLLFEEIVDENGVGEEIKIDGYFQIGIPSPERDEGGLNNLTRLERTLARFTLYWDGSKFYRKYDWRWDSNGVGSVGTTGTSGTAGTSGSHGTSGLNTLNKNSNYGAVGSIQHPQIYGKPGFVSFSGTSGGSGTASTSSLATKKSDDG